MRDLEGEQRHLEVLSNLIEIQKNLQFVGLAICLMALGYFAQKYFAEAGFILALGGASAFVTDYFTSKRRIKTIGDALSRIHTKMMERHFDQNGIY